MDLLSFRNDDTLIALIGPDYLSGGDGYGGVDTLWSFPNNLDAFNQFIFYSEREQIGYYLLYLAYQERRRIEKQHP